MALDFTLKKRGEFGKTFLISQKGKRFNKFLKIKKEKKGSRKLPLVCPFTTKQNQKDGKKLGKKR